MCGAKAVALCALLASSAYGHACAQSLRVSPVTIDLPPAAQSSTITVGNDTDEQVRVQARVFRWSLINGEDKLEKTSDVIVSPPILSVVRGHEGIVRVVRINPTAVTGEETYRVLLDEIPDRRRMQANAITLTMRHSIPVFFGGFDSIRSNVAWSASVLKGKLLLRAANAGQRRAKVTALRVTDGASRELISIKGLAGYALAGQTKVWQLPLPSGLRLGTTLKIEAMSETGPISASAVVGNSG